MTFGGTMKRSMAALLVVLLAVLAGCGTDPKPVEPSGTASTEDAWKKNFTTEQLAEYDKALARLEAWEEAARPVFDAGKVTPEAEAIAHEFWLPWQKPISDLRVFEENQVSTTGTNTVFWSKATSITTDGRTRQVTIDRCSESHTTVTQYGKVVPQSAKGPINSYATLWALDDQPYKIVRIDVGAGKGSQGGRPCEP